MPTDWWDIVLLRRSVYLWGKVLEVSEQYRFLSFGREAAQFRSGRKGDGQVVRTLSNQDNRHRESNSKSIKSEASL